MSKKSARRVARPFAALKGIKSREVAEDVSEKIRAAVKVAVDREMAKVETTMHELLRRVMDLECSPRAQPRMDMPLPRWIY